MRNDKKTEKLINLVLKIPFFTFEDLFSVEKNKNYLKIFLSRYVKNNKLIRIKKGMYASREYIENACHKNFYSEYTEFIANSIYAPSYLSLEYVLHEYGALTEMPVNFTSVSLNKTAIFSNELSSFFYHKIKNELFCGFSVEEKSGFRIMKAELGKAIFDYLYFRKNILKDKKSLKQLRLNLEVMKKKDWVELKKYVKIEGSKKMLNIYNLFYEDFKTNIKKSN